MRADPPDREKGELTIHLMGDEAATLFAFLLRNEAGHGRYRASHVAELIVFDSSSDCSKPPSARW